MAASTNPLVLALAELLADAIVLAVARPEVRALLGRGELAAPAAEDPTGLLTKKALAKKLSVSVATIDRMVREPQGMPVAAIVGDGKRFDLVACRRKPTRATKKNEADVDVSDVIAGAGLVAR